ncbi:hypothetical protein [Sinomonas terrae]|uniref:Uncharacterized protein n=1 Tax=Sinomonas terrae TaxID=2908838 RepID=A0ABS9U6U2_9MICC|nr:hypothetical protein [Sinomonas terrae]MCH6472418.1 hypothetical protein [Sinomonas terrae]
MHENTPTLLPALALTGVLASALRPDTGTAQGPARYTVPAAFSRRPEPREAELLNSADAARRLRAAGYPQVGLLVSDRRLLITDTSLGELKAGLAHAVAALLREVSEQCARERAQRTLELAALGRAEQDRLEALDAAAAEIRFE